MIAELLGGQLLRDGRDAPSAHRAPGLFRADVMWNAVTPMAERMEQEIAGCRIDRPFLFHHAVRWLVRAIETEAFFGIRVPEARQ